MSRFNFKYSDDFKRRCLEAVPADSPHRADVKKSADDGSIMLTWSLRDEAMRYECDLKTREVIRDLMHEWQVKYYEPAIVEEAEAKEAARESARKRRLDAIAAAETDIDALRAGQLTCKAEGAAARLRKFIELAREWAGEAT